MSVTAYPNPFSDRLTVEVVASGHRVHTRVRLSDVLGRFVATLFDGNLNAGTHLFSWEPGESPPGVYVVSVDHGGRTVARPVVLVR